MLWFRDYLHKVVIGRIIDASDTGTVISLCSGLVPATGMMDNNGVAMSLVSSSPDQGTITMWKYAPQRIVPEMRPYDDGIAPSNWSRTFGVGDLIKARVRNYPHEGIGEFHLHLVDPGENTVFKIREFVVIPTLRSDTV